MTLEVHLVLLAPNKQPVHSDSAHSRWRDVSDEALEVIVSDSIRDWLTLSGHKPKLEDITATDFPESGVAFTNNEVLLAEPGCCSSLSSAIALADFLRDPQSGPLTLFTGHDVTHMVTLSSEVSGIDLAVGDSRDNEIKIHLAPDQATSIADKLAIETELAVQRVELALPEEVPDHLRSEAAERILGMGGTKFW